MFEKILQFFVNLLPKPLRKLYDKYEELVVYIYYGVLTTIVNLIVQFGVQYGILNLVKWDAHLENLIATVSAWLIAVFFAFYVNKKYVFRSVTENKKQLFYEMWTFISARLASLAMEAAIMQIGVGFYHDEETDTDNKLTYLIFKFIAQVVVTLTNYFISKFIVFKKKKNPDEK